MSRRTGFTLVELVVVVLILGILAAIAVPKIIHSTDEAKESEVGQTLASIRDAVELYRTQVDAGGYPQGADSTAVQNKLLPLIRGSKFPKAKVGGLSNAAIKISVGLVVDPGTPTTATPGWVYDPVNGEVIINSNAFAQDGVTKYSEL